MDGLIANIVESSKLGEWLYSSLTATFLPVCVARVAYRAYLGRDTVAALWERLGTTSKERPSGPVIWFHAANTSESAVALPVIFRCLLDYNENVHILLTTASAEAQALLSNTLPSRVILQYIPLENPACVRAFLQRWKPQVGIFMESELRPNLTLAASRAGVKLALLNARLPSKMFLRWHSWRVLRSLMRQMISSFSLIIPQSDVDVGRFRMMGATLQQMPGWCADLKYASAMGHSLWHMWKPSPDTIMSMKQGVSGRQLWLAANTHEGEEAAIGRVHTTLKKEWPKVLTLLLPRPTNRCGEVAFLLKGQGLKVGFWSQSPRNYDVDVMLIDTPSDLPLLYSVCELVFVGNSLLEGGSGHSFAEAAVAGCAVLVGEHCGHFSSMADELNQAAVLAAEEAAAAVTSSGPLNDEYMDAFTSSAPAAAHSGAGNTPRATQTPVPPPPTPHAPSPQGSTWQSALPTSQTPETSRPATAPARIAGGNPHGFEFPCPAEASDAPQRLEFVSTSTTHLLNTADAPPHPGPSTSPLHTLYSPVQLRFSAPPSSGLSHSQQPSCPPRLPPPSLGNGIPMVRAGSSSSSMSGDQGSGTSIRLPLRPLVPFRSGGTTGATTSRNDEVLQILPEEGSPCSSTIPIGSPSRAEDCMSPTFCSSSQSPNDGIASSDNATSFPAQITYFPAHTTTTFTAFPSPTSRNDDYNDPVALESPWSCKEPGPYHQYWLATATLTTTGTATAALPTLHLPTITHQPRVSSDNRRDWDSHQHQQANVQLDVQPASAHVPAGIPPCSVLSTPPSTWSPSASHAGDASPAEHLTFEHTFLRPSPFCSSPSDGSPTASISTGLLRPSPLISSPETDDANPHTRSYISLHSHPSYQLLNQQPGSNLLEPSHVFATSTAPQTSSIFTTILPYTSDPTRPASLSPPPACNIPTSPSHTSNVISNDVLYSPDPPSLYHWMASPSPVPNSSPVPLNSINQSASVVPWLPFHSAPYLTEPGSNAAAIMSPPPLLFAPQPALRSIATRSLDFTNHDSDLINHTNAIQPPKPSCSMGISDIVSPYHPGSNGSTPRSKLDVEKDSASPGRHMDDNSWDRLLHPALPALSSAASGGLPPPMTCTSPTAKEAVSEADKPGHRWMPTEISLSDWDGVTSNVLTLDPSQHSCAPDPSSPSPPATLEASSSPSSPQLLLLGEGRSYGSPRRRWARRHARSSPDDSPTSFSLNPSFHAFHMAANTWSQDGPHICSATHSNTAIGNTSQTDSGSTTWDPRCLSGSSGCPSPRSSTTAAATTSLHTMHSHSAAPSPLRSVSNHSTAVGPHGLPQLRRLRSPVIGSPRAAAANLVQCPVYCSNTEEDEEVYVPLRLSDRAGSASGSVRHTRSLSPVARSPFSAAANLRSLHTRRSGVSDIDGESTPNWLATPTPTSTSYSDIGLHLAWRNSSSREHSWAPDSARPATAAHSLDGTLDPESPSVAGMKPHVGMNRSPAATSYMRYAGDYILPATHLPYMPHGPAVWKVSGENGLAEAVATLLREPLERRSRGHAAAQAAAKLASGLVSTVWHFLDDMVITPALQDYVRTSGQEPGTATVPG